MMNISKLFGIFSFFFQGDQGPPGPIGPQGEMVIKYLLYVMSQHENVTFEYFDEFAHLNNVISLHLAPCV